MLRAEKAINSPRYAEMKWPGFHGPLLMFPLICSQEPIVDRKDTNPWKHAQAKPN